MKVDIYSKPNCSFCDKAKIRLNKYNPKIHMLGQDYSKNEFFEKFPNAKTYPQIIIDNKNIGGYHELEEWLVFNSPDENF